MLENKLGMASSMGILRAPDRKDIMAKHPVWKMFTQGIQLITDDVVNGERWTLDQIRNGIKLAERSEKLFHALGRGVWPDERGDGRAPWLTISAEDDLNGLYPKDLFYSDENDRNL